MNRQLTTYLRDHFAGARLAIDLLETLRDHHAGDGMSEFAAALLADVRQDRQVLESLIHDTGAGRFPTFKEAAAYVAEKMTWLKLRRQANTGLGTLETLEMVALGVQGKLALWHGLASISSKAERLSELDFDDLIDRAESQHSQVERQRLRLVRTVLAEEGD